MRRLMMATLGVLILGLSVVGQPAAFASPATGSSAACTFTAPYSLGPTGVTLTPAIFHYKMEGNATVYCTGRINGYPVAGPGTYYEEGYLSGNCVQGSGPPAAYPNSDTYAANIPVWKNGKIATLHLSGTYNTFYTTPIGTEVGTSGTLETSTWQFVILSGDCVLSPVTRVLLTQQEVIST